MTKPKIKNRTLLLKILKWLGLSLVVLALVYGTFNFQAIYEKIKYRPKEDIKFKAEHLKETMSLWDAALENHLVIPKIEVSAPIIFLDSSEEKDLMEALKNGVVHIEDTALPGEEGNCVFTGHSSDAFWKEGNYKTVFTLLDKLVLGDGIIIYFDKQRFLYEVVAKEIVGSQETSILSQDLNIKKPTLSMFTCWPLGTDLKRLVVKSELISVFKLSQ